MAYSVDLMAALKANRQDNRSKPVDFPGTCSEKTLSFKDSLREAVKDRSMDESRRELVSRAETKLNNYKKPELKSKEIEKPEEESAEEKAVKTKKTAKELLTMLEELSKLQPGEIPAENHAAILEGIKEALKELGTMRSSNIGIDGTELQPQISELTAKLEAMIKELKSAGSLMNNETEAEFAEGLKEVITDTLAKLEKESAIHAANNTSEQVRAEAVSKAAVNSTEADADTDKVVITVKEDKTEVQSNESKQAAKTPEKQEVITESPAAEAKLTSASTKPEAEAVSEEVKAAVDSKVEKVTTEGKNSKEQEADEEGRDTPQHSPKAVNPAQSKHTNEEIAAIRLDQTAAEVAPEEVQKQAQAPKTETISRAEVINQIVKKAEVIVTDGKQEMRMQLEPENLGKLTLKLAVEKGLITAKFVAESYEVKQVIESGLNELKDMLQEKGLDVQNFSVSVGQDNKGYNNGNAMQQWKETIKFNSRSADMGSIDGYQAVEAGPVRAVNPYSIHNGKFDYRA